MERPASVVKELLENALDAGATRVSVEIAQGGVEKICVSDNGSGMTRADAALSVERHATSKIRTEDDINRIASFGFRGEALPSIASVAKLTIMTGDGAGPEGTRVGIPWGGKKEISPAAHPRGTTVLVEGLFARTPARRKFLKSLETEAREVSKVVTATALANHAVAFEFSSNGKELLSAPAAMDRAARIVEIFGRDTVGDLLTFEARAAEYRLSGLVTRGSITFASRRLQFFYVNGRIVEDRGVLRAIADAAREAIRTERHPGTFLFLTAPPGTVDVNVSPAKTQVRFAGAADVYRLVFHGLTSALTSGKEERRLVPVAPAPGLSVAESGALYTAPPETPRPHPAAPLRVTVDVTAGPTGVTPAAAPPPVAVLGQYDDSFIVAEGEEGLLVIDQHAAHERFLYERLRSRAAQGRGFSQALLAPEVLEASPEEASTLARNMAPLSEMGFEIEALSGRTFSISAVPAQASGHDAVKIVRETIEAIGEETRDLDARRARIAATVACKSAITIHHRLNREEMERLVADWLGCTDRFTCPHGRPTVLSLSDGDLLKFFKRK